MAQQTDYLGEQYRHMARGPKMAVNVFSGAVEGLRINTIDDFHEALRFGKYLESQGHQRYVMAHDFMVVKIAWYFSTHESGLTLKPSEEIEYIFAVSLSRRFLAMSTLPLDFNSVQASLAENQSLWEKTLDLIKGSVSRFLDNQKLSPLVDNPVDKS